jgi:hypothetical protein
LPPIVIFLQNHGEGGSSFVQLRPPVQFEPLDIPVERFLVSVRFEHKSKLDQLEIEINSLNQKIGN